MRERFAYDGDSLDDSLDLRGARGLDDFERDELRALDGDTVSELMQAGYADDIAFDIDDAAWSSGGRGVDDDEDEPEELAF